MTRAWLLSLSSTLVLGPAAISQAQSPTLVLQHVTVIDVAGAPPRKGVDVLIRGHRIERIASRISLPHGARLLPADGKFLVPGLWDMHVHVWNADLAFPLLLANGVVGIRNMGGHLRSLRAGARNCELARGSGPT